MRDELIAHARSTAPNEACGLIAGRSGAPTRVIRCANVHPTPTTRYLMEPREQLNAFRSMDDKGEELVAIYHSHPASQPYPSPTDRAESHYPDAIYVLVSLRAADPEVRAFRIKDDAVTEVALG
ncbi:MAG TPA: M67 family metallopeptidase [Candidatus Limnocylindria bacterium]|nr:M67 family metallopeptidase [Candidatus Limnocylindria bacterium]